MLNVAIEELVDAIKKYQDQSIVVSCNNGMQVLDGVDVIVDKDIIYLNSDEGYMEFKICEIGIDNEDIYVDEIEGELHIVFIYDGIKYSILNLV